MFFLYKAMSRRLESAKLMASWGDQSDPHTACAGSAVNTHSNLSLTHAHILNLLKLPRYRVNHEKNKLYSSRRGQRFSGRERIFPTLVNARPPTPEIYRARAGEGSRVI